MIKRSRPINVLFLLNGLYVGGAEKHTLSLIQRLPRSRFESSVIYLKPVEALKPEFEAARPAMLECLEVKQKIDFNAARRLAAWCDQKMIDVVIAVDPYPMLVALMAKPFCEKLKPKIVDILHMTDLPTIGLELQYQLVYRWLFKYCDEVFFVSRLQMEHWKRRGLFCQNLSFIHNGVDESVFTDSYDAEQKLACRQAAGFFSDDFVIAICASLRPEKGHIDLIDTMALLREEGISAKALIIGDGPMRRDIESRVNSTGLSECVHFTGMLSDVKPWIATADCVVLPSHSETFSLAALEAMALCKPVIATRIGGTEEQISNGQNGYLFERGNLSEFSRYLISLAKSGDARRLGANARQRILRDFTLDVMVEKYARALEVRCFG